MKNLFVCILLVVSCFTFCKKKDKAPEAVTNTTTGAPVLDGDHGTFLSVYNTYDFGNRSYFNDSTVLANFYDSAVSSPTSITAGIVSVNSKTLTQMSNYVYTLSNQVNMKVLNWQVAGSGTITAGSFSYVPSYPCFTGGNLLPDTVTKTNGFNFNVSGVTNVNESVYVTIEQNTAITKTVSASGGNVSLNATEISGYTSNSGFTIRLSFFNYSRITFNSLQYGINSNCTYQKTCYLKQ